MKTFKIAFFALLFMMTGVVSAASLSVTSVAGGTNNFETVIGAADNGVIHGSGSDSVRIESGDFSGTFEHHFDVVNSGSLTFRLHAGASSIGAVSDFHVWLDNVDIVTMLSAGVYVVNPIYSAVMLSATETVDLIVSGTFTSLASYDVVLNTPIPAAVWLFGSALMGLFGVSRRKSTAVAA